MIALFIALLVPSAVVLPPPSGFDHAPHAFPCTICHPTVADARRSNERSRPDAGICNNCHLTDPKPLVRGPEATPALHFNHRAHADRGVECAQCHPQGALPTEADCRSCHNGDTAPSTCNTCHPVGPDGRLRTAWPRGQLKPATGALAHGTDWVQQHALPAKTEPATCDACHTPRDCSTCHQGRLRPVEIHPADYILSHPAEARRRSQTCETCHRPQTFCRGCHAQSGVVLNANPLGFGVATPGRTRFHPAGWTSTGDAVDGRHHRFPARRDLVSCASCHAEADCVRCHATDAPLPLRHSPHTPGNSRRLCRTALRKARSGCQKCHRDASALERLCGP